MSHYVSTWSPLPDLPDSEGFAGMFAGTCGNILICAGGTNFPDKPMLEGGKKTWTDRIFTLAPGDTAWQNAGTLPLEYAYGASVSVPEGLLCIGGCDSHEHKRHVYLLSGTQSELHITPFPDLPIALAYHAAVLLDNKVYTLGGCERPGEQECTDRMFVLDLADTSAGWQELPPMPARGRFLHQMACVNGCLYTLGGIGLVDIDGKPARELLAESWRFSPLSGWQRLPDMPYPVAAAPTPAPVSDNGNIYILGGDDGSGKKYTPQTNPGFNNQSLCFNTQDHTWHNAGSIVAPRAVLPCCVWHGKYVAINGELKPGRRSPQVWSITVQ